MKVNMRKLGLAPVVLLLVPLLGCPPEVTDDPDEPQAEPMTVMDICLMYLAESEINGGSGLCTQAKVITGLDLDSAAVATGCRPGTGARTWSEDLMAAVAAGRVTIDWNLAHECVNASRDMRQTHPGYVVATSGEWSSLRDGACKNFYTGAVADGGSCEDDWDCLDGSFCYSDNPFTPGSTQCLKPAASGQPCGTYRGCAEGLSCDDTSGLCITLAANGEPCDPANYGDDCQSGVCGDPINNCLAPPEPIAQGQPCTEEDTCANGCGMCKPASAGAPLTCEMMGKSGDYCRDWNDCLWDLGCVNNACGTVGDGQNCGSVSQALCEPGLSCVPPVNCSMYAGDQTTCENEAPICAYDANYGDCSAVEGICTGALPTSGPCLHALYCGEGFYCQPSSGNCEALATENAACSDDGTTAPPCYYDFYCVDGSCKTLCEYNEDCGGGQFCSDEGNCEAFHTDSCSTSTQCVDGQYCAIPEASCDGLDEGTCGSTPDCAWTPLATPVCSSVTDCLAYDGDQTACEAAGGCVYDLASGYCDPSTDCGTLDQTACGAEPACVLSVGNCDATGSCMGLLAVGEECIDSEQCASGDCNSDDTGVDRCAVELSGCDNHGDYVRSVFLFGGVWILARGLRRRRSK